MKPTRSTPTSLAGLLIILNACLLVWGESGCPPPEDIVPCHCFNSPHFTVLECKYILDDEILKGIFQRSKDYSYSQVHIKYSTLKFFPKEMFDGVSVEEIHLKNSTLNALFDSLPKGIHTLRVIHLENTKIVEISHWELLQPLTHLRILNIYFNQIERLDSTFGEYVTKDLEQISFYGTGTQYVTPGALVKFTKLSKVALDRCKLKEISRDIFPRPFNVRVMYFNNNKISAIPDDMFHDMPYLQTIGLRENLLTTIPESAFMGQNTGKLEYLFLNGNPMKCNCSLLWLINNKPDVLSGTCVTPIRLHDKEIAGLTPKDLKC